MSVGAQMCARWIIRTRRFVSSGCSMFGPRSAAQPAAAIAVEMNNAEQRRWAFRRLMAPPLSAEQTTRHTVPPRGMGCALQFGANPMQLIVQPDAGVAPILLAMKRARKSIDVLVFRHDIREIADTLAAAVGRGVVVRALIACANKGGTKNLRKLEARLLEAGVSVSRTGEDLLRYHGKMMILDGRTLHVYGFNFTWLDIDRSRSFGIITKNPKLVQEALKLFENDVTRKAYAPSFDRFVVSPENARKVLGAFV